MAGKWLPSALGLTGAGSLFLGLRSGALWDPHELSVAELSRRIALNLLGGADLAIAGADNSVPIRAELGRGELPFTSAALGYRLFGLNEWAGRLPLVLWAVLSLGVFYAAVSRLWDRRAALYAVLVLASTPCFFLQARTLLGDAVTLASFTLAWSGLSVATSAAPEPTRARLVFGAVGLLGLYAGFWCRGPIVSVAVPALAVGLASRLSPTPSLLGRLWGVALLSLGALSLLVGALGLSLSERTAEYSVFVGSVLPPRTAAVTFDAAFAWLLHAAFPWTGLAPLALGLVAREGLAGARRGAASGAALGLAGSLAAASLLLPALGVALLPALCCFALLVAGALRELELQPRSLPVLGLACAALTVLLGLDFVTYPNKAMVAFNLRSAELPAALAERSAQLWKWGALLLAGVTALCFYEAEGNARRPSFRRREYGAVLARLQRTWDGNLVFAALVLEAALVGFLLLSALSERFVHLEQLDSFGVTSRKLVAAAAVAVPCAGFVPLAALAARDLARRVFSRWHGMAPTRAQGVLGAAALVGFTASVDLYPQVAEQVAPKKVFERYRELGLPDEPLGMVGEGSIAARYQAGARAEQLSGITPAFEWLTGGGSDGPRRWLLIRKPALAELNARYRERYRRNLPILDARSSELLLASNRLRAGERDESPLRRYVLDAAPAVQHPLRAVLGNQLELVGWSVVDGGGRPVPSIAPATPNRLVVYWRVLAPLSGPWQMFVHLDGLQRRFNADHVPLADIYPISAWRRGDILVDSTEVVLEPNFTPGSYRLYLGLYDAERRLPVTEGPAADDRISAGVIQVD